MTTREALTEEELLILQSLAKGMGFGRTYDALTKALNILAISPLGEPTRQEITHAIDHFEPAFIGELANERETWIADNMRHEVVMMVRKLASLQEWRGIESAPNDCDFRWYGLYVQQAPDLEWFEAYYVAHSDHGEMIKPNGDNFDDWAFSDFEYWCDAPAPPSIEKSGG